jgi:hypothetical protein
LGSGGSELKASNQIVAATILAALLALSVGCKHQASDNDAIRAGISQHLASLSTLNLSAMDMDVNDVTIQGLQARAQVTFRPKTGAPAGAGMQVAYQLEKRDSSWVVVKTEAAGGMIAHPVTNANPYAQAGSDSMHGNLPNFRDMLPPSSPQGGGALPPGHPAIDASSTPKPKS